MKKKKYVKAILVMMLGILLLGLPGCKKEASSDKKEENVWLIEESVEQETLMQGTFETETPDKETSRAETLGGSKTLEVIPPKEDNGDENTEETQKGEWIPGIW